MPRYHLNPVDGSMTPIPDGIPDEQVPAYAQSAQGQRQMGQGRGLEGLTNVLAGVAQRFNGNGAPAPISGQTMPQGFPTTAGLGLEGTMALLGQQQRSNESDVGAKLQQRAQMEQQLEAEKDRAQQIKVENQRLQNDIAMAKMREKLELESAKREVKQGRKLGTLPTKAQEETRRQLEEESARLQNEQTKAYTERAQRPPTTGGRGGGGSSSASGGMGFADMPAALKETYVEVQAQKEARKLARQSPQVKAIVEAEAYKRAKAKNDNDEGYWPWNIGHGEPTQAQIQAEITEELWQQGVDSYYEDFIDQGKLQVMEGILGGGGAPSGGGGVVVSTPAGPIEIID